jgi:DNA-damage-inducible protein D
MSDNSLIPIDGESIRKEWHSGEWHYSLVDMIMVLLDADYAQARNYWKVLKHNLIAEGNETVRKINQLRLKAADGKMRLTDVVNTEQALRLIQSIPSPKVEPLKLWLAQVGAQKIEEASEDPEAAIYRAMEEAADKYRRMGRTDSWIEVRVQGIVYRKQFTEALKYAVVNAPKSLYAQSTEKVYKGLLDMTTAQLRGELNITPTQNPRDYMGEYALIYIGLTERLVRDKLKEAQTVLLSEALEIIWDIAKLIREQYLATQNILGKDLLTEKPLLDRPKH